MVKAIMGFMLVDAPFSALNNQGMDAGDRTENITRTKYIRKGSNKIYPYVSGQAVRYWWRSTLEREKNGPYLRLLERKKSLLQRPIL
ncbi:MAG: hypothetical protein ACFFBD_26430 [Candidatus Hodarchaeota archaeon]